MLGAIAGDIIGSVYEARPIKSKSFSFFSSGCRFTDDSVLTAAVADAILHNADYTDKFHEYFAKYPHAGFGGSFMQWAMTGSRQPYYSFGNGSAMRVSPVGFAFADLDALLAEAEKSAAVTHNHPEGIKGAQATAAAVFMANTGADKDEIRTFAQERFGYSLDQPLTDIRQDYHFDVSCQGSVPQSLIAFFESTDYEDAVRNAISLGGDADTMAAIAGAAAEAAYGLPDWIRQKALSCLDVPLKRVVQEFTERFMTAL
ncbi:MAG: ADP-ribosylglycohydrolase family protein [Desulfobacterales bacterium]|nr:ADP-ribosylglycohydrolase family protein [Desulfobacterales bacterium]